ncbi:hypothetical protein R3I93_010662 [Phoxinus phoxinus]|uniref:Uncharacterized protein n=1 Tax=Phoxinus phoxinus TaxID=58324 RepID=A0AAN9CY32_9TELE
MTLPPTQNVATNVESTTGIKSGKMACTILMTVSFLTSLYAYIFKTRYRPTLLSGEWFSVWRSL